MVLAGSIDGWTKGGSEDIYWIGLGELERQLCTLSLDFVTLDAGLFLEVTGCIIGNKVLVEGICYSCVGVAANDTHASLATRISLLCLDVPAVLPPSRS